MDVNEEIVITWLEKVKNMFTQSELYFGNHHSDIDILAVSLKENEVWDCEVKVRTGSTNMDENSSSKIIEKFNDANRNNVIKELIGNQTVKHVLLISKNYFGNTDENIKKWEYKFTNANITVIYIDTITQELKNFSKKCKKTTNSVIQILKLSE